MYPVSFGMANSTEEEERNDFKRYSHILWIEIRKADGICNLLARVLKNQPKILLVNPE